MPLRMLGCALLMMIFAAFSPSVPTPTKQDQDEPLAGPRWEYKTMRLERPQCSSEQSLNTVLNTVGEKGWELVSYEQTAPSFPEDAEGDLLIRPAATGPGKLNTPQTADSFEGVITLKMGQSHEPVYCLMLFKRLKPKVKQ